MQNSKLLIEFIRKSLKQTNVISEVIRTFPNEKQSTNTDKYADIDASILDDAIGWPFYWAKGSPNTPWADGKKGVDCSGFVEMALVKLGLLSRSAIDRNSHNLARAGIKINVGEQIVGDIAYYTKGHVAIVIGPAGPDGHSPIMGTTGGGKTVKGNDLASLVRTREKGDYRDDFGGYYRIRD